MKTLKEFDIFGVDDSAIFDKKIRNKLVVSIEDLRQSAIDDIKKFRFDSNYLKQNLDGQTMTPEDYRVFQVSYDFVITYIKEKFNINETDLK